jgi:predicted negative regulator of RcsB-dependent stress response
VKRNYFQSKLRLTQTLVFLLIATQLVSCSYLTTRKSLFGDSDKEGGTEMVPKSQYDTLMKKYEMVLKQKRDSHINSDTERVPVIDQDAYAQKRPDDMVNELNRLEKNNTKADLAETVDVFSKDSIPKSKGVSTVINPAVLDYDNMNIGKQIAQFRNAKALLTQNKHDAALSELKILEGSKLRQIAVRAKFNIGELLFKQGEFDLAMQIYEEILQKDAFSGLVLKTLGRLIVCSTKLKLKKKEEQYYSVLHDFFEQG